MSAYDGHPFLDDDDGKCVFCPLSKDEHSQNTGLRLDHAVYDLMVVFCSQDRSCAKRAVSDGERGGYAVTIRGPLEQEEGLFANGCGWSEKWAKMQTYFSFTWSKLILAR